MASLLRIRKTPRIAQAKAIKIPEMRALWRNP